MVRKPWWKELAHVWYEIANGIDHELDIVLPRYEGPGPYEFVTERYTNAWVSVSLQLDEEIHATLG